MTSLIPQAPRPAAPRPFHPPELMTSTLGNGLAVVVAPRRGVPLIGAQFTILRGAAADSVAYCGLSDLMARLLGDGSITLPSEQFSLAMDAIGAKFAGGAGYDSMTFGVSAMKQLFPEALRLAADAIRHPAMIEEDFERIRMRTLSELRVNFSTAGTVARLVAGRILFADHPYGAPLGGTPESTEACTLEQTRALAAARILPKGATLILVGDLSEEEGRLFAHSAFGDWKPEAPTLQEREVPPLNLELMRRGRKVLVDLPDPGRSAVVVCRPGVPRSHPRYLETILANALLSGYSGRLNREIRVKRGLSYGASSSLSGRRLGGAWVASTLVDHAKVDETVKVMLEVLESLGQAPPSEEDLNTRKAMLRGSFGRALETVGGLASSIGGRVTYGLPLSELSTYLERLEAITPQAVAEVAKLLLIGTPHIVVVGEAGGISGRMKGDDVEFCDSRQLDLRTTRLLRQEPWGSDAQKPV